MIPTGQTLENWQEMLTVQVFRRNNQSLEEFSGKFTRQWAKNCKGSEYKKIRDGNENGYGYTFWLMICSSTPAVKMFEFTMLKAIRGKDALYVIQKAFRFSPSVEQVSDWSKFLRKNIVCDSRIAERACPENDGR